MVRETSVPVGNGNPQRCRIRLALEANMNGTMSELFSRFTVKCFLLELMV